MILQTPTSLRGPSEFCLAETCDQHGSTALLSCRESHLHAIQDLHGNRLFMGEFKDNASVAKKSLSFPMSLGVAVRQQCVPQGRRPALLQLRSLGHNCSRCHARHICRRSEQPHPTRLLRLRCQRLRLSAQGFHLESNLMGRCLPIVTCDLLL